MSQLDRTLIAAAEEVVKDTFDAGKALDHQALFEKADFNLSDLSSEARVKALLAVGLPLENIKLLMGAEAFESVDTQLQIGLYYFRQKQYADAIVWLGPLALSGNVQARNYWFLARVKSGEDRSALHDFSVLTQKAEENLFGRNDGGDIKSRTVQTIWGARKKN